MKTEITTSSWEDVVFESRNKEYGAYAIRKSYDEKVTKASLVALLFAAFIFGIVQIASLLHVDIKPKIVMPKRRGITNPPIIIRDPVAKRQLPPPEHHVTKNLLERVVTHEVIENPPTQFTEVTPSGTQQGTGTGEPDPGVGVIGETDPVPVIEDEPSVVDIAEVMPAYEGGPKALARFISKNIHYSGGAKAMGQEGTVYVRFVVNSLGQVVDVEVLKGVSGLLDKEAVRVISLMNKWKPGMQHNLPVNVRMVMPIKFVLSDY